MPEETPTSTDDGFGLDKDARTAAANREQREQREEETRRMEPTFPYVVKSYDAAFFREE